MAWNYGGRQFTLTCGSSYTSTERWYLATVSTAGQGIRPSSADAYAIGVVQNYTSSGGALVIQMDGITKATHDGTCVVGSLVSASTGGLVKLASTGVSAYLLGIALAVDSTVANTIITMTLNQHMRSS